MPDAVAPGFVVGTGRCGTHLLAQLLSEERDVASVHESAPVAEAFHRYCQWNDLPVDAQGLLAIKRKEIEHARLTGRAFCEASAYLSLAVGTLHEAFGSRVVLLVRDPVDTVNSLWVKGWYEQDYVRSDDVLAVGYHDVGSPVHFFSRLVPRGPEARRWSRLSRIGKLAWFWSELHRRVLEQLARFSSDASRLVKIEELRYGPYVEIARFLGSTGTVPESRFDDIVRSRPGSLWRRRGLCDWTKAELDEFAAEAGPMAERLGYATDYSARWDRERGATVESAVQVTPAPVRAANIADAPATAWLGPIVATVRDGPDVKGDITWALSRGIHTFRVNATQTNLQPVFAIIAELARAGEPVALLVDVDADHRGWIERLRALDLPHGAILVDRSPDDLPEYNDGAAAIEVIPSLTSANSILQWRRLIADTPAVFLSWSHLLTVFSRDDLYAWLQDHYEDAARRRAVVVVQVDADRDPEWIRLAAWAFDHGVVVCPDAASSETSRHVLEQLVALREDFESTSGRALSATSGVAAMVEAP